MGLKPIYKKDVFRDALREEKQRPYFNPTMSKGGFLLPSALCLLPSELAAFN